MMIGRLVPAMLAALAWGPAAAACPIELAVYADLPGKAEINFLPTGNSATVTNSFKLIVDPGMVLDGIVMWSESLPRSNGTLMYQCPEGDVTGTDLAGCTAWQGVIYTVDAAGAVGLLPAEGTAAPQTLILSDLAPSLMFSPANGGKGFSTEASDVFSLTGCQE